MNIHYLKALMSRTEELFVIDKAKEVKGITCNVIGIARNNRQLQLLILQYDEAYRERGEADELLQMMAGRQRPESNRELQRSKKHSDFINPFQPVRKVYIGETELEVSGSQGRRLNLQDWESILLLSEFLRNGWQAKGIDYQSLDSLFLTSLELNGEYLAIPTFSENSTLRFIMGTDIVAHPVEKPMTLAIGDEYPEKLRFCDGLTGEEHWAQINRVYLTDMWGEMEKIFNDPKVREQMTPEQLAEHKLILERDFSEVCPRGMYFPTIEYECQEDISLQFYTKAYLDAKPANSSKSMGFIVRPEETKGILGLKLKATVIPEPVTEKTDSLEVELFQYFQTVTGEDIVFE